MTTTDDRVHLVYADADGNVEEPAECIEECPGCHYEGNAACIEGDGGNPCSWCTGEDESPYAEVNR